MRSQSKWVKPPPPMKNIHGGPAVNPCTQGPEFVRRHPWLYLRLAAAKTFRNRDVLTPEISVISNRHDKKHVGLAYI